MSELIAESYFATPQGAEFLEANDEDFGPEFGFVRDLEGSIVPCMRWYGEVTGRDPGGIPAPLGEALWAWVERWFPIWPGHD